MSSYHAVKYALSICRKCSCIEITSFHLQTFSHLEGKTFSLSIPRDKISAILQALRKDSPMMSIAEVRTRTKGSLNSEL